MSAQGLGGGARLHRCNVQSGAVAATERRVWRSRGLLAAVFSERSCIGMGGSRTAVAEVLRDPNELANRPPRTSGRFRPSGLISASDYDLDPASSKPGYEVKPANQAASHQVACGGCGVSVVNRSSQTSNARKPCPAAATARRWRRSLARTRSA
jgi:hypothetical protein